MAGAVNNQPVGLPWGFWMVGFAELSNWVYVRPVTPSWASSRRVSGDAACAESEAAIKCRPASKGIAYVSTSKPSERVPLSVWPTSAGVAVIAEPFGSTSLLLPERPMLNTSSSQLMDSAHDM